MKGGTRQRNDKWSYYFKYQDDLGKWKTKEKGGFATKKEANSALRKAIIDFEDTGLMTKSKSFTVDEYVKYWFENVGNAKLTKNTLVNYESTHNSHISPLLGHLQLNKVTGILLQNFFTTLSKTLGESSLRTVKALLNNIFKFAKKQKLINQNPLTQVEFTTGNKRNKVTPATPEELKRVADELEGNKYYLPFFIGLHTGLRRGEILGLTWDDINFKTGMLNVNKQLQHIRGEQLVAAPKTISSIRVLMMTEELKIKLKLIKDIQQLHKEILGNSYISNPDYVCCTDDGEPLSPCGFTNKMHQLSQKLDIHFKTHSLRHYGESYKMVSVLLKV